MRKSIGILTVLFVGLLGAQRAKADSCNGVAAGSNLIQNCAFGTGDFTSWSGSATTDPNNSTPFLANGIDTGDPFVSGPTPYNGLTYEAYLGAEGSPDTLSQTFATTAGDSYTIEFALLNDTTPVSPYTNSFAAAFGGTPLLTWSDVAADDGYTLYSYTETAGAGASTTLAFTEENDSGDFELDSVSVEATPAAATPEPSSFLLLGSGVLAMAGAMRRRFVR
jgi:hypothetical protein